MTHVKEILEVGKKGKSGKSRVKSGKGGKAGGEGDNDRWFMEFKVRTMSSFANSCIEMSSHFALYLFVHRIKLAVTWSRATYC